jgi:acetyl esterase
MPQAQAPVAPLDPGMLAFNQRITAATPPEAVHWPLARQRAAWDEVCRSFSSPRPAGIRVDDVTIPGPGGPLKLRLYRPAGEGARPGVLYFHGGGWILGSLETHDDMCAEMAAGADVVVIAVDYRLAPEHPHPAQFEDNLAARDWVLAEGHAFGVDTARLVAAGDSAGGQMTAALAIHLRDRGLPQLVGQVLIYPVLGADVDTPSYRQNEKALSLSKEEMVHYLDAFLGPAGSAARADKFALPLLETDYSRLPPAFVTAAGHDPLHDDAVAYAERLSEAGVAVALRREPSLGHSYMRARRVSRPAGDAFEAIVSAIRDFALGPGRG